MRSSITATLLLLSITLGCAGNSTTASGGGNTTRARIENNSSLDMDIYVVQQTGATRLGFVPANDTARFELTPGILAGAVSLRFEARPVRRSGRSMVSELFQVTPGDEIVWSVPGQ
jgi:hypothetical protein